MYSSVPSIALVYFCCSINLHRTRLLYYWWILCPSSYSVPKECIIHGLWLRFSFAEKVFYRGSIMQLIEMFPIFFFFIHLDLLRTPCPFVHHLLLSWNCNENYGYAEKANKKSLLFWNIQEEAIRPSNDYLHKFE